MKDFTFELDEKSKKDLFKILNHIDKQCDTVTGTRLAKLIGLAAQEMATEAKLLSPFKYGRLRSSIHAKLTPTESYPYADDRGMMYPNGALKTPVQQGRSAVIGTNVEYALVQELKRNYLKGAQIRVMPYLERELQKMAKEVIRGK